MIARGDHRETRGIFSEMIGKGKKRSNSPRPDKEAIRNMILRHSKLQIQYRGEFAGMREMRKHVAWYTAGYPNSAALRNEINSVATLEELTELIGTRL